MPNEEHIPTLSTDDLYKYTRENGGDIELAMQRVEKEWGQKSPEVRQAMMAQVSEWRCFTIGMVRL